MFGLLATLIATGVLEKRGRKVGKGLMAIIWLISTALAVALCYALGVSFKSQFN
jgi:hypothetical protein